MSEQKLSNTISDKQLSIKIDNMSNGSEKKIKTHKHCNRCASLHDYTKVIKSHNEFECKWVIKCCEICKDTNMADYRTHNMMECKFATIAEQVNGVWNIVDENYDDYDDNYSNHYDDYDDYDEDYYDGDSYCDSFDGIVGRWRNTKDGRIILLSGISRFDS
jgi:hypothetical protein